MALKQIQNNGKLKRALMISKREVERTPTSKYVEISRYNPITKKGVSITKDITLKSKDKSNKYPREVYIEKDIVKRNKDSKWKSYKNVKKAKVGLKTLKKKVELEKY